MERTAESGAGEGPSEVTPWADMEYEIPAPPAEWLARPTSLAGDVTAPPQLVRTVNILPPPEHDLRGPDDAEGLARFLLARANEGIGDVLSHEDYDLFEGPGEAWARLVAEHQTGIPYTMPAYFYGSQARVARAIVDDGAYPLMGQCQQSVTTALCIGGWDGAPLGDIGCGLDAQPHAASAGKGWPTVPFVLADWPDELWAEVGVGSCLFWSAPCPMTKGGQTCTATTHVVGCGRGSGHVAMVMRKHPTERKWQLWDTTTSFTDPAVHPAVAKGARMLWESHWWEWIPKVMAGGSWSFRGIARLDAIGATRMELAPRGRARLLLVRRSDRKLLFRSEWLSMAERGLPISWLFRSLRGAPFADQIEPTWCVNSLSAAPGPSSPDNRPLLDCTADASGIAKMSWRPSQGLHDRPSAATWSPPSPFPGGGFA